MPLPPFEAPRLKLRRARHHVADLAAQIDAYIASDPLYFEMVEADEAAGFQSGKKWVVRVRQEVPPEFSAIIGDAIHNLRTALDLLACELVRSNGKSDKDVHFPFAESATALAEAIKKRNMDRANAAVVALLQTSAPYKGGNEALRAIHDLDIMDKHQALIPRSDMIEAPEVPGLESVIKGYRMGPVRAGMSFAAMGQHVAIPVGFQIKGRVSLTFEAFHQSISGMKIAPLRGGEVVPTLESLAQLVEGLIEAFIQVA